MKVFNRRPVEVARQLPAGSVRACTDVTGFGLAGHASEIAAASGVSLHLTAVALPMLPGAERLAAENLPCGGRANARHFQKLSVGPDVDPARHLLCLDPQTSGGLLLALDSAQVDAYLERLGAAGGQAWVVGDVRRSESSGALVFLD